VLGAASFTSVSVAAETAHFVYPDEETGWASLWSYGIRGWLEAVEREQGPEALQQFKSAALAQLQAGCQPDGFPHTSSALPGSATKPHTAAA